MIIIQQWSDIPDLAKQTSLTCAITNLSSGNVKKMARHLLVRGPEHPHLH